MKKISLLLLLSILLISNISFSQVPWSTVKPPLVPNYKPAIIIPWENPNRIPTYIGSPSGIYAVGPNFRVLPNTNQQDELYLSSNPAFPMLLYGASNSTAGSTYSQGVYVSTNGGLNWYGTDIMPNCPVGASDPAPAIDKNGVFVFTTLDLNGSVSMLGQYSTNYGVNWSTPFYISGGSPSDKNLTGTDDVPSSPYYGRTYTAWSKTSGTWPIMVSYTTNSGVSWSAAAQINNPSTTSQGADVVVGPGGVVYVVWSKQSSVSIGVGMSKSTNGGTTWTANETIFASGGMRSNSFNGWGVRVNDFPRIACDKSGGPRNGWLYIVDCEKNLAPAGTDEDVILHKSTDGGTTWSSGIRVNQDALNNGKVQFFPCVVVDPTGGVNVLYYDNRNYPSVADSCETYLSRSLDGGTTWTDTKVSDHRWKPQGEPGLAPYMGDYIGMTATNGKLWPFWFDNKSGSFQAWTCSIDFGPAIAHTPLSNTEQTTGTRAVNCTITPAGSGINPSKTKLFYGKGATFTDSLIMTNTSGTNWLSTITLSGPGVYKYYITTTDSLNRTATAPAGAPGTYYSFTASPDTTHPVVTHTPIGPTPKSYWPVTVTANVTDNIGVDSVWVMWYKNTPTIIKEFKLLPAGSNNFSAAFNSINSDVNLGDVIYYKIMADDISSNHNVTSLPVSGYFSFGIVNLRLCEGFNSTTFPPTNWSLTGSGTSYWSYNAVSGYGLGTGSGRFNFYSATSGVTAQLVTLQFDPSTAGDSIKFVVAHAYYSTTYIDTLKIESSTDNGTSWTNIWTLWSNTNFTDPHSLSTVSQTSLFVPTASQWKSLTYVLPVGTNKMRFNCISGYGNDMFIDSICQISGPTGIGNITTIPLVYSLSQNYPNPFNPVTQIKYGIPKQGLVTMKVYDVLGREITKLVNEVKAPGSYIVDFDGSNLSSGVYFYRLESNGFVDVKKMLMIK